jgi:Na+-translocating ferredoxin:NAD+ oxidoreductase RnfG subunit
MGIFDIHFSKKAKLKNEKSTILEFLKKQVLKDKIYENKLEKDSLTIQKCTLNTLLRYNLKINTQTNKKDSQIIVEAELHDTLILAILIILSIVVTYGFGIIFIIGFTYYQKVVATKHLETLINNYASTI